MSELLDVLMDRDDLSLEEAKAQVALARKLVNKGEDPAEVLRDKFGLEPDYVDDLCQDLEDEVDEEDFDNIAEDE